MTLLNEAVVLTTTLGSLCQAESAAGCNGVPFYALPGNSALSSLYFSFPALLKSLELSVKLTPLEPHVDTAIKRTVPCRGESCTCLVGRIRFGFGARDAPDAVANHVVSPLACCVVHPSGRDRTVTGLM